MAAIAAALVAALGHAGVRATDTSAVRAAHAARLLPLGLAAAVERRLGGVGVRQSFTSDGGLHVHVRESAERSLVWSLVPTSLGRAGAKTAAFQPGAPHARGRRTSYDLGAATSWYRRSPAGIEQGFTIFRRPRGDAPSVAVALRSSGSLRPVRTRGGTLALVTRDGHRVLTYGNLAAVDATGRSLRPRFVLAGDTVRIVVPDRGAVYPITVDPLVQRAGLANGDSVFGLAVAISADGSTVAVGDQDIAVGSVFTGGVVVFTGPNWTTQTVLTASNAADGDLGGTSVAISADGSTIVVGAPSHQDTPGVFTQGEAYIFSGTHWGTETPLLPTGPLRGGSSFGKTVGVSADGAYAIVSGAGIKAFVFSGPAWATQNQLALPCSCASTVGISSTGPTAVVGAAGLNNHQGAMFVFKGSGLPLVGEATALDGRAFDRFGAALALSADGSTAVVGALAHNNGSSVGAGAVYIFRTDAAPALAVATELIAPNSGNDFGWGVAVSANGQVVAVGGDGGQWVYSGPHWGTQTALSVSGVANNGNVGLAAMATTADGSTVVVGSSGAVYVLGAPISAASSTISASPASIPANGSTTTVTLHAKDLDGGAIANGGDTVTLATTAGTLGPVTDNGDGTYTASLTSPASVGQATISGTIAGAAVSTNATVSFTLPTNVVTTTATTTVTLPASTVTTTVTAPATALTPVAVGAAPPPPTELPATSLGAPTSALVTRGMPTTILESRNGVSAVLDVPAGALPVGAVVSIYPVIDPAGLATMLPPGQPYLDAFAVSWRAADGTSPGSSAPVALTIVDPEILAGDAISVLVPGGLRRMGTSATGSAMIGFTNDPVFLVTAVPKLSLVANAGKVVAGGVQFKLACSRAAPCRGDVLLGTTTGTVARGRFSLAAGRAAAVRIPFTPSGKALLRLASTGGRVLSLRTRIVGGGRSLVRVVVR